MSREQLHSATVAASVAADAPAITVLMHGLGGNAGDWANDFHGMSGNNPNFKYDEESIIEKMRASSAGINLYRAETTNAGSFTLYSEYGNTEVPSITDYSPNLFPPHDFSKHTVIVVHITDTWIPLQDLYERLHYIIDKISYDYDRAKSCLPRINLIGHSMGGLLNMQYAIEHPKNVASLVSLGTPYNGSWYDNWFVEILITDFKKQPCITGKCGHNYYFCDIEARKSTWNNVYAQNTHINFHALSGQTSLSIMEHIIWTNFYLESYLGVGKAAGIRSAFVVVYPLNLVGGLLPGDLCVDADSQQAVGFNGAVNYTKIFKSSNCNVDKRTRDHVPLPHNLETFDKDMQNYILRVIDYGSTKTYHSYTLRGMQVSIIDKVGTKWTILLTNKTGSARNFEYNQSMCFDGEAQSWNGLGHIESTMNLANGASTTLEIQEYGTATTITISYSSGNTRYIFYANNLDKSSSTMVSYATAKSYYSYSQNGMEVSIVSKYREKWTLQLTNNTGSTRTFDYNQRMCNEGDARNWNGLRDVATTVNLAPGTSTILEIQEYGTATSIAISYTSGSIRYIHYAKNLSSSSGTMSSYSSGRTYYSYSQNNMKVSIVGKNITTWTIELTNNTGSARSFEYNKQMCNEGDARSWKGLTDIASTLSLANGETTQIEIQEYGTASSIALSYVSGNTRYIFYAKNLDMSGTMTSFGSTTPYHSYSQHNMNVAIVGKNGNAWTIQLTNNTGSTRSFEYNRKMCFEGDAQNWKGLSDTFSISLADGASTTLSIQENGTASSIAISYVVDNTRYIFYAKNLNASGTMTAMASSIDTSAPPAECVAEGSMITLADGSQKAVETLTGDEMLLVWNMQTGTFDSAPILFIDSDAFASYKIINLRFSDGTEVEVIYEHAFWDIDLNRYVFLRDDAEEYIGHRFNKQTTNADGEFVWESVQLTGVEIYEKYTTAWSPVTTGHLCYYVNGMLSMPGGITGLINILEIDSDTMTVDQEALTADIETYGLFTYEEFAEIIPVPENIFEAFNGQYLKISIGKGLIDIETLESLIERYAEFF